MKHAANRSRTADKPKAKTLSPGETIKKAKSAEKKTIGKIALKSNEFTAAQKTEIAVKTVTKNRARASKPADKQNFSKASAEAPSAVKSLSGKKVEPTVKQAEESNGGKITPKNLTKSNKTSAQKTPTASPVAKAAAFEKKIKNSLPTQKTLIKTTSEKPNVAAKPTIEKSVKAVESQSLKAVARTAKSQPSKAPISAAAVKPRAVKVNKTTAKAKINTARLKAQPVAAPTKKLANLDKAKPFAPEKTTPEVPNKKSLRQSTKIQSVVSAKKTDETMKKNSFSSARKTGQETIKLKSVEQTNGKTQKLKSATPISSIKNRNTETEKFVAGEKAKLVENVSETTQTGAPKPKNKKAKPIGSAVFRGRKERYDFKVFELDEVFEPIPAVYIISKRKIDKRKKGHHALICIGETSSISEELKRHRKGKCVKKHEANVVSILPEADEKTRLKIETDLKAAHAVACILD